MAGTDVKAERKDLYAPRVGVFVDIAVPPMTFLAIDGSGDPNVSEDYRHAIEALFSASYEAKFLSKRELHRDYVVLPQGELVLAHDDPPTRLGRRRRSQ